MSLSFQITKNVKCFGRHPGRLPQDGGLAARFPSRSQQALLLQRRRFLRSLRLLLPIALFAGLLCRQHRGPAQLPRVAARADGGSAASLAGRPCSRPCSGSARGRPGPEQRPPHPQNGLRLQMRVRPAYVSATAGSLAPRPAPGRAAWRLQRRSRHCFTARGPLHARRRFGDITLDRRLSTISTF